MDLLSTRARILRKSS